MNQHGPTQQHDVSVIIVTRNRPKLLCMCLEHLTHQQCQPLEVIVVDSSTDEQSQGILNNYPHVIRLRVERPGRTNINQARNLGIHHAQGAFVAFLDDDCMAEQDWLCRMMEAVSEADVGIVGGRWIDDYEINRINPHDSRIGYFDARGKMTTNFALDPGEIVEATHVRGGNVLIRREVFEQVGTFDQYFDHCAGLGEETDLCLQAKRDGWRVLFQPRAAVRHLHGDREDYDRTGAFDPSYELASSRGYAYLFSKNFGFGLRTFRHILMGRQILHVKRFLQSPSWTTFYRICLYDWGSLRGMVDSLAVRLRPGNRKRQSQ